MKQVIVHWHRLTFHIFAFVRYLIIVFQQLYFCHICCSALGLGQPKTLSIIKKTADRHNLFNKIFLLSWL